MLNPYQQLAVAESGIFSKKKYKWLPFTFIIYIDLTHKACLMEEFFNKNKTIIINKTSQSCQKEFVIFTNEVEYSTS